MRQRLEVAAWALEGALTELGDDPTPSYDGFLAVMAAKAEIARAGVEVCDLAMQVAGGSSYFKGSIIERCYRDIRAAAFHPLTPEATLLAAGQHALGLPLRTDQAAHLEPALAGGRGIRHLAVSTCAPGGPCAIHASTSSTCSGVPSISASTLPSRRLRTHPATPASRGDHAHRVAVADPLHSAVDHHVDAPHRSIVPRAGAADARRR